MERTRNPARNEMRSESAFCRFAGASRGAGACPAISIAAGDHRGAVRGRRRLGPAGAARCAEARGETRQAVHHREPAGRCDHARRHAGRARGAGRLHADAGDQLDDGHQRVDEQEAGLRAAQGSRAGRAVVVVAVLPRGQQGFAAAIGRRPDRARQGQAEQPELRLRRARLDASSQHRTVAEPGRDPDDARALQGDAAGDERSARRQHPGAVRRHHLDPAVHQAGHRARARGHHGEAQPGGARCAGRGRDGAGLRVGFVADAGRAGRYAAGGDRAAQSRGSRDLQQSGGDRGVGAPRHRSGAHRQSRARCRISSSRRSCAGATWCAAPASRAASNTKEYFTDDGRLHPHRDQDQRRAHRHGARRQRPAAAADARQSVHASVLAQVRAAAGQGVHRGRDRSARLRRQLEAAGRRRPFRTIRSATWRWTTSR